jgi:transposase
MYAEHMPAAYTRDLRERLLRATDAGLRDAEIARTTGVSVRSLARWRALQARGESLAPKPRPRPARRQTPEQEQLVIAQVADRPDATLDEHRERLAAAHGLSISRATTGRILQRHRLTLKKRA